jgi:hypothetical protein
MKRKQFNITVHGEKYILKYRNIILRYVSSGYVNCSWATPRDSWSEQWIHITTEEEKNDPNNDFSNPFADRTEDSQFL